ncbi:RDD family protein [Clostridium swellfunianum]|uniref:RDD family protein n=1 Tax=Clostridium swellfunianum TaxID=1367462 RepID=UPI00202FF28D|nr:RDD family protein [Clostridium swellfunianum]MCM0647928.1 RDD family protein [Clostridium swellfunianum]
MKKIKITTPENIEVEYTLADIGSRTAAVIIDSLVQGLFILILGIAIVLIMVYSQDFWQRYYGWIVGISLLTYAIITYGYFIAMELSMNGQTLGKKAMHLRTIRTNGQPITLKHSAIRNLFRVFADMLGIGAILIFFNKQHKRLGDMAASTIVVVEENKSRPITLEDLYKDRDNLSYYLSKEEQELLRDYFNRKSSMTDYSELREELINYFSKKFQDLGLSNQWEEFKNKF